MNALTGGVSGPSSHGDDPKIFPPRGSSERDILVYRDRLINPWSLYRNQRMSDIGLWMWFYLGRQHVEIDTAAAFDGVRGSLLRELSDQSGAGNMPRPVTNKIDPAVEQAVISLVEKKWTGKATPSSNDPAIKAAAQVTTDVIQHRLDNVHWPMKRRRHAFDFVLSGTGLIYTTRDKSYIELRDVGAESAVWCPACGTKLYSAEVPGETLRAGIDGKPVSHVEAAKPVMPSADSPELGSEYEDLDLQKLSYCPTCPDAHPLEPYEPTEQEAATGIDPFGRGLGIQEPKGSSTLDIDLPFEFYPQDNGYQQEPGSLRRYGRRKIRSRDWVEEHYPHLMDELEPNTVQELLYNDPILGSWDTMSSWSPALDTGILDDHFNVDELVEQPTIRNPLGRYAVCLKNRCVEDSDLLIPVDIEDQTHYVARSTMSIARYKLRPNEIWGTGLPAILISPQKRLNGLDSQLIHWRLSMGSPNIYMPQDMWVDNPVQMSDEYGPGRIFLFQPSTSMPEVTKPEIFGGQLMNSEVYMERDRILTDMKEGAGPQDATRGAAPKNISTTSGLQFLVDQDERGQSLREEELVQSAEKAWSHIARMEWLLQVDQDSYRVLGPNKTWSYRQYKGTALRGEVEVKIERGSSIAKSTLDREAAREAQADMLIDKTNPAVRRQLLELYGLDPDLSPDVAYQVDHANRVWVDFRDKGQVRILDVIDDPQIHYFVLSSHLRTEEGERLADEVLWDDTLRKIAGWQDELVRLTLVDQQTILFYGGRLVGDAALEAYGKAMVSWQQQNDLYQQQLAVQSQLQQDPNAAAMGIAAPTPLPPQQPPPPIFLPALIQDRVLLIWQNLIQQSAQDPSQQGVAPTPPPEPSPADIFQQQEASRDPMAYVRFRALVEAYRWTAAPPVPPQPMPGLAPPPMPGQDPNAGGGGGGSPAPDAGGGGSATPPTSSSVPGPATKAPLPEGGGH